MGVSGRYAAVMQQVAPGCVGDGDVVFERFGDGLVGAAGPDGDTCAACKETIGGARFLVCSLHVVLTTTPPKFLVTTS